MMHALLFDELRANPDQNGRGRQRSTSQGRGGIAHACADHDAAYGSTRGIGQVQGRVVQRSRQGLGIAGDIHEANLQAWGQGSTEEPDEAKVDGAQNWIVGGKEKRHED